MTIPLNSLTELARRVQDVNKTALDDLKQLTTESRHYKTMYVDLQIKLNYLSFAIVGAVLALNQQLQDNIWVLGGCGVLLINALASYIHIARYYQTNYENHDGQIKALNTKRSSMTVTFNDLLKGLEQKSVEVEKSELAKHKTAMEDLLDFKPADPKEFMPGPLARFYFYLIVAGLGLIGAGIFLPL